MTTRELREEALKIGNQARALLDTITPENRSEKEAEFDRMMEDADSFAKRADSLEKIENRQKAFEAIDTEVADTRSEARATSTDDVTEFRSYLRGEARAQSIGNDSGGKGGVFVPTTVLAEIVAVMKDYGPFNEGGPARVIRSATGSPIKVPTANNTAGTSSAKSENAAGSAKDHDFGSVTISVSTYDSGLFQISNELVRDSVADIVSFVVEQCGENLGRKANAVHTANMLTGAASAFTAAGATVVAADDMLKLAYAVNSAYRRKGGYMFNSATELAIRLLKDGQNNYLWQPSYSLDKPNTVAGFSYWTNDDMPSMAVNAKAIAFGDFSRFYVRYTGGIEVKSSNDLLMASNATAYIGFMSTGSAVVDNSAIKYITQAAS